MGTNGNNDGLCLDALRFTTQGWFDNDVVVAVESTATRNYSYAFVLERQQHVFGLALRQCQQSLVYRVQINFDLRLHGNPVDGKCDAETLGLSYSLRGLCRCDQRLRWHHISENSVATDAIVLDEDYLGPELTACSGGFVATWATTDDYDAMLIRR